MADAGMYWQLHACRVDYSIWQWQVVYHMAGCPCDACEGVSKGMHHYIRIDMSFLINAGQQAMKQALSVGIRIEAWLSCMLCQVRLSAVHILHPCLNTPHMVSQILELAHAPAVELL